MAQQETAEPARAQAIVPLLDYQREDVESDARFRWNCWARQTGKSFTKSLRRILRGLARRRTQIFLSAGERQCRELMQKAREHCQALKIANDYYDNRFFKDLSIKQLEGPVPVAPAVPFAAGPGPSQMPDGDKGERVYYRADPLVKADPLVGGQSADGTRFYRRCRARRVCDARVRSGDRGGHVPESAPRRRRA